MFFPVDEWFAAFLLTIAVETPVVVAMLRRAEPELPRLVALAVFASLMTHPVVWFVFTQLFLVGTVGYVMAAETWAIGTEALFYLVTVRGAGPRRALLTSLVANGVSIAVGWLAGMSGWSG